MAKKIYLSPSDQTSNKYAYGGTNEETICEKIADACEVALKRCGFEVKNNKKSSMAARVAESNSWGADLHVPIHTNAYNKKVTGTRMFSWDTKGEGYKACLAIFNLLAPLTPGTSENIKARKTLYEVRVAKAPTAYIEVDFHDVYSTAKWMIEHTTEVGETIAHGICNYFGVKYVAAAKKETTTSTTDKVSVSLPVIKNGCSGEAARAIMLILRDKGYYASALAANDDDFGPIATAALKKYQTANGLESDGICGKDTWSMLLS